MKRVFACNFRLCRTFGLITVLEHEMDTWNLISSLYKDRYATERQFGEEPMFVDIYVRVLVICALFSH